MRSTVQCVLPVMHINISPGNFQSLCKALYNFKMFLTYTSLSFDFTFLILFHQFFLESAESIFTWVYGISLVELLLLIPYMMTNKGMLAWEFSCAIWPSWEKKIATDNSKSAFFTRMVVEEIFFVWLVWFFFVLVFFQFSLVLFSAKQSILGSCSICLPRSSPRIHPIQVKTSQK